MEIFRKDWTASTQTQYLHPETRSIVTLQNPFLIFLAPFVCRLGYCTLWSFRGERCHRHKRERRLQRRLYGGARAALLELPIVQVKVNHICLPSAIQERTRFHRPLWKRFSLTQEQSSFSIGWIAQCEGACRTLFDNPICTPLTNGIFKLFCSFSVWTTSEKVMNASAIGKSIDSLPPSK